MHLSGIASAREAEISTRRTSLMVNNALLEMISIHEEMAVNNSSSQANEAVTGWRRLLSRDLKRATGQAPSSYKSFTVCNCVHRQTVGPVADQYILGLHLCTPPLRYTPPRPDDQPLASNFFFILSSGKLQDRSAGAPALPDEERSLQAPTGKPRRSCTGRQPELLTPTYHILGSLMSRAMSGPPLQQIVACKITRAVTPRRPGEADEAGFNAILTGNDVLQSNLPGVGV
ncbi:hypothetical protein CKAH01_04248 [Colletotrichum kahawae]|uniref:Uncharacterized protein n=1 Tax=Colletotrichum kahawae TaxID=34407 RepID=A0AAD9YLP1_COLKA|nr:hypothetical protein CKAH01_04248 [Colletotrichum kahawae]